MFEATEFNRETCETTGRTFLLKAKSAAAAVRELLRHVPLEDSGVRVGPTGRVLYAGEFGYTVTPKRTP